MLLSQLYHIQLPLMTKKFKLITLLILLAHSKSFAYKNTLTTDSSTIKADSSKKSHLYPKRLAIVGGVTVFTYSYIYYYMKTQAWWKENPIPFHFDAGRDKVYARGHDKMGHLFLGAFVSDRMGALLEWSGIEKQRAALYGALWSSATQFLVEVKDGYAPTYGFSWRDATWGSMGCFYPYLKLKSKFLANTEVKFSYFPREYGPIIDPTVRKRTATWHDDYINQTYWFSVNIKNNIGALKETKFPDWLNMAVGVSLDQTTDGFGQGNRQWYLGLDIDTKRLFKPKKLFWKTVVNSMATIKIPTPAIQFGKNVPFKFYPIYF